MSCTAASRDREGRGGILRLAASEACVRSLANVGDLAVENQRGAGALSDDRQQRVDKVVGVDVFGHNPKVGGGLQTAPYSASRYLQLMLLQGGDDPVWTHGQLAQAATYGVVHGVGNGGHRRHQGHFADAADPVRAGRVGHFDQNRLNQGNVKGGRHPIVEEGRVGHLAIVRVEVALGERPANPLHGPTLDLTFDI